MSTTKRSEPNEFPELVDAAGVKWTLDYFPPTGGNPVLCFCDVPGKQIGYAYVGLEESFADLKRRLPPAADRAAIFDSLGIARRDWIARQEAERAS